MPTHQKTVRLGVVMHSLDRINPKKDTSFACMIAAQGLGLEVAYIPYDSLYLKNNIAFCEARFIEVHDGQQQYYTTKNIQKCSLNEFNIVLMRNDPPVDESFLQTTYILDRAAQAGVYVTNPPQVLRIFNEKLFATEFPNLIPDYVYSHQKEVLLDFIKEYGKAIVKPIDGMGGRGIFYLEHGDTNSEVTLELLTHYGKTAIIAQQFIPQVKTGDKRILILNGKVFPYSLLRTPKEGSVRGNLAAGGSYSVLELTERDVEIAESVAAVLNRHNISLAGIDVIGDYLTEINITSPTGMREIARFSGHDPAVTYIKGLYPN